jgi:hypothetical protein
MSASVPSPRTSVCSGSHVAPPSGLRLSTRSVGLASLRLCFRASQKASMAPDGDSTTAGMRYVCTPS